MALPAQVVALLLTEHRREAFAGPVLAYGRQRLDFTYDGALWMLESLGLTPHPDGTADRPPADACIDLRRLVKLLGLGELAVLEAPAAEGIDIVADLNDPVPADLAGRFGLIVDGGALESVFDIRQGMKNTAAMLRPGGRIVHVAPVNNYVNRGYVQRSPTFYHDFYVENGFDDVRGIMMVQPRSRTPGQRWNMFRYDHVALGGVNSMFCPADTQLGIYFTARKNAASTTDRIPVQSYFTRVYDGMDALPGQYVVTHDPARLDVRQVSDPEPRAGAVVLFSPIWSLRGDAAGAS